MLKTIPWDTLGPIATAVIIILIVVFGFMLRWQKATRPTYTPSYPPKDINSTNKKTLCFKHEGGIASNTTAIGIFGAALVEANKENSNQHGKIFDKMEDLKTTIITEIKKVNGG